MSPKVKVVSSIVHCLSLSISVWAMGWPGSLEFEFQAYIGTYTTWPLPSFCLQWQLKLHNQNRAHLRCDTPTTHPLLHRGKKGKSEPSIVVKGTWTHPLTLSLSLFNSNQTKQLEWGWEASGGMWLRLHQSLSLVPLFPACCARGEQIPEKRVTALL